jgi:hypothetical protein
MAYVLGYWFADGNMYFQKGAGRYFVSIEGKKKACIAASLPNWCVAGTTGFEPAISTLTGSHPRPLDDVPHSKPGDPSGIRTHDLHLERVSS